MPSWEFPAHEPVDLKVRVPSGEVTVSAAATQTATVALDGDDRTVAVTRVEFNDGTLSIVVPPDHRVGSLDVAVELPEGSSCRLNTASGDIECTGELGALDVQTASGDVSAERVSGPARVVAASGNVSVGQAHEANVDSASGDVRIGWVSGDAQVRSASGDVHIEAASGRRLEVKSASGDISVAVAPGIGVYLDLSSLSGTVSCELEPGEETEQADMTLACRTISGDVRVGRAKVPARS